MENIAKKCYKESKTTSLYYSKRYVFVVPLEHQQLKIVRSKGFEMISFFFEEIRNC